MGQLKHIFSLFLFCFNVWMGHAFPRLESLYGSFWVRGGSNQHLRLGD